MECMRNQLVEGRILEGRYETISALNHGSFGMVFMARDLYSGELVALKCLTKNTAAGYAPFGFAVDDESEELKIHLRIGSHPNIVNLHHSFETQYHSYLVLEFCPNGDLYEAIRLGKGPLETEHVRDFMLQLVDAVQHLHSKGIYHRDIKPENIFLSQTGSMKLGDFGLATAEDISYDSAVGSDRYMAPEQYDAPLNGYSPAQADVWAIGICLLNVLFSRNPFATPTLSDPLFADFAGDRQTLFDVFPNLSQDTYEILDHCLQIDPAKRSLSAVREALERAISFTTDDESLDEFCTEDREPVPASANREPLRTPSISSPHLDQNGSFPWAKALAMTPQQHVRQLSAIPDERYDEDLFPCSDRSGQDWFSVKPDTASTSSFVDSGLGVSLNSTAQPEPIKINRPKPSVISGSLPINVSRVQTWGKKRDLISKSWSDLWDEEEEEAALSETENLPVFPVASPKLTSWREESESGLSTPRAGLREVKNPSVVHNSRNRSPAARQTDDGVSELTGFVFEPCAPSVPRYSPPPKRSLHDKWAVLGDRRRGNSTTATPMKSLSTPLKPVSTPAKSSPQPQLSPSYPRKRSRAASWRRNLPLSPGNTQNNYEQHQHHNNYSLNNHGVLERKEWSISKDWRKHAESGLGKPQPVRQHDDDIGDLEWVGGWNDLHL